jgi:hypothetical protein
MRSTLGPISGQFKGMFCWYFQRKNAALWAAF